MYKTFILFLSLISAFSVNEDALEIQTEQGLLRGKFDTTRKGRAIRAFTGIPFAKPPIGELRFRVSLIFGN